MNRNLFYWSILLLLLLSEVSMGQVGGISGSKLDAVCVDVVDHHKIEFEPGFYHFYSGNNWDSDGQIENLFGSIDSIRHNTGFNFRFTYGLWDKLEVGTSISTDLQVSYWGLRYVVYSHKKVGMAVIAGANFPFDNRVVDKSLRLSDNLAAMGGGV